MRLITVLFIGLAIPAYAQDNPTCTAQSQAKNLHGAAETSFLTRCRTDCTKAAEEKKIYGAARNSFVTRCQS